MDISKATKCEQRLKSHTPKQKGYNLFLNYFGNEIVNYEL